MDTCIDCDTNITKHHLENGAEQDIDGDWYCCDCAISLYNPEPREYYTADELVDLRGGGYYSDAEFMRDMRDMY